MTSENVSNKINNKINNKITSFNDFEKEFSTKFPQYMNTTKYCYKPLNHDWICVLKISGIGKVEGGYIKNPTTCKYSGKYCKINEDEYLDINFIQKQITTSG